MSKTEKTIDLSQLAQELENDLLREYGPMLTGENLRKALGYPTMEALHQALYRKTVPVPTFRVKNRRGSFALVKDVAIWLADQRNQALNQKLQSSDKEDNHEQT